MGVPLGFRDQTQPLTQCGVQGLPSGVQKEMGWCQPQCSTNSSRDPLGAHLFTAAATAAAAKSRQLCPTLCDPIDSSPPASPVLGILQARILKWVPISFYNAWKWKVKVKLLSHVRLLVTPWTIAYQAPPSMGFTRQEYWSGLPLPSPLNFNNHFNSSKWYVNPLPKNSPLILCIRHLQECPKDLNIAS